ncbi:MULTISPECIES: bifunctional adenosylcobinamide kinase/adenosylcobinamide-phosphate guanylyltransferase [unclassified Sphingomonas]|uniref:bifunctional adenosylcobinamide kinase/adenosylcobinamide-phosphate guanylyltransferase n=1 Tax=unclassified Sphingomonas TaxID=196159 RepID=UPI0006FF5561|nr:MULTISPECIES: bifunctional adenosylcobinamide kinase/adenosylcobinamide-phosphate guanylyltransferase [unclassified Sphingomonas]KQX19405.1 adenosylcobinamide kinase/adenosylcobinamide phosphate guanyltransferase [Sphingomonas sp. Root1294]KQY65607.1 adenosylcobinamide kinase/adenosylcobinamide phosphate guanyltransferase [Sphingomonas sp. Root50]KRB95091.1 adenosylcobinamide kinase/adenosylcobinamide phosphate guanyltransferase [Sphingomonas sp. Root720]
MGGRSLLVLGGARSGKSRYAQARAEATGLQRLFVATAQAFDDEMRDRIARHRDDRDAAWQTVETPLDLAGTIVARSRPNIVLLIDCLTLWTTNLILGDHDCRVATAALVEAIGTAEGPLVLVANEVGFGIVPDNALARRFRDEAGIINQRVGAAVDEVQLVAAGLPLKLK